MTTADHPPFVPAATELPGPAEPHRPVPGAVPGEGGRKWNGPAVISAAAAVVALAVPLVCCAAFGFGVTGLRARYRERRRGTALAVLGVVLSVLWAGHLLLGGRPLFVNDEVTFRDLRAGDCYDRPAGARGERDTEVVPVPCEGPHQGRVYAEVPLSGGSEYPDPDGLRRQASERCGARRAVDTVEPGRLYVAVPAKADWRTGRRTALCHVVGG